MTGSRPPYDEFSRGVDETERFSVSERPWYLKRWVLALWGLTVLALIAVIVYGLTILARGNGGSAPAPTSTRPPTTTSEYTITPSPTPSTTAPTTTPPPEESTIDPVPPSTYTTQRPKHHWRHSNLPPLPPIPHF